jgi:hypothetical protein
MRLLCLFNRHNPDRRAVQWDGRGYVGTCQHCGTSVRRLRHNRWKADEAARLIAG